MRSTRLSLLCLAALILSACSPKIRGVCNVDSDCPEGTSCQVGLCIVPTEAKDGGNGDGGTSECVPECGADSTCVSGQCLPNNQPFVFITSPATNTPVPGHPLEVTVRAHAPDGVSKVEVHLNDASATALLNVDAAATGAEEEYKATIDLADPQVTTGDYQLVAILSTGDTQKTSAPVTIHVVKSGPVITILPINYPVRSDGHPSTGAFLRNETVEIQILVTDDAGLGTDLPVLTIAGMEPVTAVSSGPKMFTFKFDGRLPPFKILMGEVAFSVTASNAFGLSSTAEGTFQLSRWKWTWAKQRTGPIRTAPALAGGLLYLGSDDNYVYALHPDTGDQAWDFNASSPVIGHITAGDSRIYAATKEGRIYALDPVDAPISDTQRRIFRCPDATGGLGNPTLREFKTGPALMKTPRSGSDSTLEETLINFTSDGHLRLIRQSAFPQPFGQANGCVWEGAGGLWPTFNSNDAVVPTVVPSGSDNVVYLADQGGVVRRLTISLTSAGNGQQPTFRLNQDWSKNVGGAIHGSLAYGYFSGGLGVLAMREDSRSYGFTESGADLWTSGQRVLPGQSRVPPSLTSGYGFVVDMNGNLAGLKLNDGQPAGTPVPLSAVSTNEANAGAITGNDGRVYYASGTKLQSVALGGVREWVFEPTPGGAEPTKLDIATPALGCDGTLYVTASNSKNGYVHAIITDSTGGMADGPWTRPMHDSRNTSNASAPLSTSAACTD